MIEFTDVSISLGSARSGVRILDACTATLESGTITQLRGDNGSGKTTLIRALAGIQNYTGSILFDGRPLREVRAGLYVCWDDAPVFPHLNGYENIRMLLGRAYPRVRLAALAPTIADHALLRQPASRLSHGQRKRVHLLAALASGAEYLVLDEALGGVDEPSRAEATAALQRLASGATILVTGHADWEWGPVRRFALSNCRLAPEAT